MKRHITFRAFPLMLALLCLMACRRHQFRANLAGATDIKANISIMEFKKKLYPSPNGFVEIKDDYIIEGVVVANDKEGNFYKQIIIQDISGGIAVLIDGRNLFNEFPIGRKVFVRTKGLALSDYAYNVQLGSIGQNETTRANTTESKPSFRAVGIPTNLMGVYLEKGTFNNPVTPLEVEIDSLNTSLHNRYQNMLIVLRNMEAANSTKGATMANPNTQESRIPIVEHTLKNCYNSTIALKTSNYALFAKELLPQGNGSVVGIFTPYRRGKNVKQISIRSMGDLDMKGARCGSNPEKKTIAEIRNYTKGKPFPLGWYIEGQVISESSNEACANYVLQDKTSGIQIRFSGSPSPAATAYYSNAANYTYADDIDASAAKKKKAKKAGAAKPKTAKPKTAKPPCSTAGFLKLDTLIRIDISGLKLGEYNGTLQIDKIPQNKVSKAKDAQPIQAKKLQNIQEVYAKGQNIVFQLVAIPNVQICMSRSSGCQACPENTRSTTSTNASTNCAFPIIAQATQSGSGSTSSNPNQDTITTYVRGTSKDLLAKVQCYAKCKGGQQTNTNHLDTIKGYIQYFKGKPQITLRTEKDLVAKNGNVVNGATCPCACQTNKRVQGSRRRSREGRSQ